MSSTMRGPYVNDKSKRLLEQKQQRAASQQRVEESLSGVESYRGKQNNITTLTSKQREGSNMSRTANQSKLGIS